MKHGLVLLVDEADKAPTHVTCVLKNLIKWGEMALSDGRKIVPRKLTLCHNSLTSHISMCNSYVRTYTRTTAQTYMQAKLTLAGPCGMPPSVVHLCMSLFITRSIAGVNPIVSLAMITKLSSNRVAHCCHAVESDSMYLSVLFICRS